jgi:GT2 family glycosyltransferase
MFYEDLEWCMRIRRGGWKIFYQPQSWVYHLGGQSTRKNLGKMLVISQHSLFYLFNKYFGRRQVFVLRLLTIVEMLLRSVVWSGFFMLFPSRRDESRQRLRAYREILFKSVGERTYWAPLQPGAMEHR